MKILFLFNHFKSFGKINGSTLRSYLTLQQCVVKCIGKMIPFIVNVLRVVVMCLCTQVHQHLFSRSCKIETSDGMAAILVFYSLLSSRTRLQTCVCSLALKHATYGYMQLNCQLFSSIAHCQWEYQTAGERTDHMSRLTLHTHGCPIPGIA